MNLQESWIWTECWKFTILKLIKEHFSNNLRCKISQKSYKNGIALPVQVNGFTIQKFKPIRINFNSDFQYFFLLTKNKLSLRRFFLSWKIFNLLKITFHNIDFHIERLIKFNRLEVISTFWSWKKQSYSK